MQWSRVMRTGIGKWESFAAATIKGGSCPSISWKPMSTSSNILCLSTFKTSPGKYSYESWVERAAKVVKFIKSVGRLVGWTWHSPQRSWRRWPRLMSTCCFSSWLVLTFKESNYRSRSFFRTRCSCLPSKYCFNNPLFKWVFLFSPLCFLCPCWQCATNLILVSNLFVVTCNLSNCVVEIFFRKGQSNVLAVKIYVTIHFLFGGSGPNAPMCKDFQNPNQHLSGNICRLLPNIWNIWILSFYFFIFLQFYDQVYRTGSIEGEDQKFGKVLCVYGCSVWLAGTKSLLAPPPSL